MPSSETGRISGLFPSDHTDDGDGENPLWESLPFKLIKEIQHATSAYGPTFIFVGSLTSQWMTDYDWFQVTKTCLAVEIFLLWKVEYEDLVLKELVQIPQILWKKEKRNTDI